MTTLCAILALSLPTSADPTIQDVLQRGFKDASMTGKPVLIRQSELVKIKKDFANNYRVKSTKLMIKEPHMIRIEAKIEETDVLYIMNGKRRLAKIPRAGINSKESFDKAPGKRQTFLDFGLLTPSMFDDPFAAKFVRVDRQTGDYVFDITYQKPDYDDTSRHRIWVDPQKKFTKKREWYAQDGRFLATFLYEEPTTQNGATVPTKVSVLNVEGKLGGVTEYTSISINSGLSSSLFEIR